MFDLDRHTIEPYAGTGHEARRDGTLATASLAQPSGLAAGDGRLYVADSESNSVRAVDLPPGNAVTTIAGGDLFEFGDADGVGDAVRLQHPLGLAWLDGRLFLADTYNHRIKQIDAAARRVTTLAGTGRPGDEDGAGGSFAEPGGLAAYDGRLYVADTNNHAVRIVDTGTGEVGTLALRGVPVREEVGDRR